jgi:hypothetical protein
MIPTTSFLSRTGHNLLLGSLLALGLVGCGASPQSIGEKEQPITANDPADGSESAEGCALGSDPDTASTEECQATARGLCFATTDAACACAGCGSDECVLAESFPVQAFCSAPGGGSDPDHPDGSTSSDPDAPVSNEPTGGGSSGYPGTGATTPGNPGAGTPGCGEPGQTEPSEPSAPAACNDGVPRDLGGDAPCDFIVGDACFDSSEIACACAGCGEGQCLVLESYPAQIRCQ